MNLDKSLEYLKKVVVEAGKIAESYFESKAYTSKSKGGVDFVTQADLEIDLFLQESIKKQFPATALLTEETAPNDYLSLKNTVNLWIIDPLDGTVNFSRKNPHFAISIALVEKSISKLALVYKPMTYEMYWAKNDKSETFKNEDKIAISSINSLNSAVIACDWSWILEKRLKMVKWVDKLNSKVRQIAMRGSAVADLASLSEGKIDAYLHSGLKPWDVAASSLFIEKAAGKITTPAGKKWHVFESEILATNGVLHNQILHLINS